MKKVNFTNVPIKDIEGNETKQNVAQAIGNLIFNMADDVAEHDLGIEIYHSTGDIVIDEKKEAILKKYLPALKYNLRTAIERFLFA
jgi:chaperonin cofactor prefoldin